MSDVFISLRDIPALKIEAGDYVLLRDDGTAELVRPLSDVTAVRVACEAGAFEIVPPRRSRKAVLQLFR